MQTQKTLVLIDGSSYLYRAFHAMPPLTNSHNEPTGAVYGVVNMIKKLINEYKPEHVAVIFDAKGKNFRHEIYPAYKATRPPMDPDLQVQIEPLHNVIKALGLPLLMIDGVEADDVIGTLAIQATKKDYSVVISTGDKDMAQLVDKNISLINTMNNTVLDETKVKEKFGVAPKQIIDYLALVGDTSDNVPGVPSVGPKTAAKWLLEYNDLDGIIKSASDIKGKVGESLRASLEQLPMAQKLVTIKHDLDLNIQVEDLIAEQPNNEVLVGLFARLEFKTWLKEVITNGQTHRSAPTNETTYRPAPAGDTVLPRHISVGADLRVCPIPKYLCITQETDFDLWHEKLLNSQEFAFDIETTSLDTLNAEIVGLSFAINPHEAIYIPLAHTYPDAPRQLDIDYVLGKLKPIFINPKQIKLGQNIKYDMGILANYGIELQGLGYDTMLESYILNSSVSRHDKQSIVLRYLGESITTYEDVAGKGAKQVVFSQVDINSATNYAAADADLVLRLHQAIWPQIAGNPKQAAVFKHIEMPLISVLSKMERHGVCIDSHFLNSLSGELAARLDILQQQIYTMSGAEFNINSPLQLQEVLYNKLQLPIRKKTPTGQPSTAEAVLQDLALDYELPKIILEYRSLSKLKSTYTDALPKQINPKTLRIHTSYNQAVTATGRLSSTDPNLQNIPIRTQEGRKIREAFIAPPGCKIIAADYSQIELRVMAHISKDPGLLRAFQADADIHKATAAEIFGIAIDQVTDSQRRSAKTINFGLIYGMSAFGLAKRLGIGNKEAQNYIDLYFTRYPGVKQYMEETREFAEQHGFVETISGRRLLIPGIKSKNFAERSGAQRAAINAPMQGSAAEIMKLAMINMDNWLKTCDFKIAMIMQVHDELVFEVANEYVEIAVAQIRLIMENAAKLDVKALVDIGIGDNWEEAH